MTLSRNIAVEYLNIIEYMHDRTAIYRQDYVKYKHAVEKRMFIQKDPI